MTFKTRITIALAVLALLPLALVGLLVRREMTARLTGQANSRVAAVMASIRSDLRREVGNTRGRLRALGSDLAAENRFRIEAGSQGDRTWLLDWAQGAMRASGLGLLLVQDSAGRVLSSGHFRNEYDRLLPGLPNVGAGSEADGALVLARTPDSTVLALVAVLPFTAAGRRYTLLGGRPFDPSRIAVPGPDPEITVALVLPGGAKPDHVVDEIALPYVDTRSGTPPVTASVVVTRDPGPVAELRRQVDRFFLGALAVTLLAVIGAAVSVGRRVTEPLAELAAKTERLDLDRLDQTFDTDRADEVGTLSRVLDTMTGRLRFSATRLREAERRAALGDLARQVNHDVKNGLVPIRNVVRHLTQAADREPDRMAEIYGERRGTLESSIEYLDSLAKNYAKLSPAQGGGSADVNQVALESARSATFPGVTVECDLARPVPAVRADPLALRRVLENLISNAVDAAASGGGTVVVSTAVSGDGLERTVRLAVRDSGPGMTRDELDRAFEDFYTTKPNGTGLGLSVVRRLVADLGATLRVETQPGNGSTFIVEIPAA